MRHIALATLVLYTSSMILPADCISQNYLGTTFYLAPMPEYNSIHDLLPVQLKIASNEPGTVRVIMPALEINITYLLTPKVTNISITGSEIIADAIGIDNKGIQILSTVEVAIYVFGGYTKAGSGKVMAISPVINSAKVFVVQSYKTYYEVRKSHFIIIATEDLTDVNIKLKTASSGTVEYNNVIFKDGDIISITLNHLQTFYAYIFANDLSGSLIESNKPIAVFSGTDCVDIPRRVGGCNIIESQMIPVSQWGNVYIVPTIYPGRCHVRVFAFHNATRISVRSKFDLGSNITLNQGEFWETTLYGSQAQPLHISSDTTINIVLYGASIGSSDEHKSNPFMLVVPDIHQYSTLATTFPTLLYGDSVTNEGPFENYAAIVLLEDSFNQLQYNGNAPDVLQNYSLQNEFTVVITPLKNVTTHTISTVSMSTPMLVFVYGMAWYESYGFVAGYKVINADCKDLVAPLHGSLSSDVVPHGNHVIVSCHQGYTLSGERTLVCSSGYLSANIGTCEANCDDLVAPTHGFLSSTSIVHGSHVTVSCNNGYSLSGERTLICLSGSLSGTIGACDADCSGLVAAAHGSLSSNFAPNGHYVTVSCDPGYKLTDDRILVCSSGFWFGNVGACVIEEDCNGLEAPMHGTLSSTNISHGNYLTVSCSHGFTLSGERTLICLSGSLSANIGSCESDCSGLVAPAYGSLSSKVAAHGNYVTVSCDSGYTLSGDNIIVCSSGSWSGNVGTCTEDEVIGCKKVKNKNADIMEKSSSPTIEGSSPVTGIIVGAVLGFIIIVFVIIIVVMCIQNKRKAVKDTSASRQTLDQVQVNETEAGNNPGYTSLTNDRSDSSTYATLNVSEAPYLTPVSSYHIHYNGNI